MSGAKLNQRSYTKLLNITPHSMGFRYMYGLWSNHNLRGWRIIPRIAGMGRSPSSFLKHGELQNPIKSEKNGVFFFRISSSGFNGHFRNRFIGGTYYIFLAYFSGLCKGISPQNMALYGTVITSNLGS